MSRFKRLIAATSLSLATLSGALALPAAAHADGGTYTIRAGDTLFGIASRAGVSLRALLQANGLTVDSLILPGQELVIPAGGNANAAGGNALYGNVSNARVRRVLDFALAQVGKPYVFFTKGSATFDCSGLTLAAFAQVGVPLVHHAATQAKRGQAVDYWNNPIRAGDLVFLDGDWDGTIDHVGIALGPTTWVQASQSNGRVIVNNLPSKSVIVAVRRIIS